MSHNLVIKLYDLDSNLLADITDICLTKQMSGRLR